LIKQINTAIHGGKDGVMDYKYFDGCSAARLYQNPMLFLAKWQEKEVWHSRFRRIIPPLSPHQAKAFSRFPAPSILIARFML
jgi:hypothetical protein